MYYEEFEVETRFVGVADEERVEWLLRFGTDKSSS